MEATSVFWCLCNFLADSNQSGQELCDVLRVVRNFWDMFFFVVYDAFIHFLGEIRYDKKTKNS